MLRPLSATLLLLALALAGCASHPAPAPPAPAGPAPLAALRFLPPVRVDNDTVASEPSVKALKDGTLFVAAPTGVVKYATRPQDLVANAPHGLFQGAAWRSKDHGATWQFMTGLGPLPYKTAQPGGGDSDIAVDGKGTAYVADQFGLATESVAYTTDEGDTWNLGSSLAGGVPTVDREWLWPDPDHPGTLYMDFLGDNGIVVAKSTDQGATWAQTDAVATQYDPGPIVALHGGKVAFSVQTDSNVISFVHSEDGGATWKSQEVGKGHGELTDSFPQTVADKAGMLYVAWTEKQGNGSAVAYTSSRDGGKTWSNNTVAFTNPGLGLFLWMAGGDAGRLGFSWYEAPQPDKEWYEHAGIVVGADAAQPRTVDARVSEQPVRVGEPCQGGVSCTSGRELGDFQQCAVTPDGKLVVSYVTVIDADSGGRVTFGMQAAGPGLLDAPFDPWVV